jgi:hypothetical protein
MKEIFKKEGNQYVPFWNILLLTAKITGQNSIILTPSSLSAGEIKIKQLKEGELDRKSNMYFLHIAGELDEYCTCSILEHMGHDNFQRYKYDSESDCKSDKQE